jgi:hypothetical protein
LSTAKRKRPISRATKLLRLGQAHLAPGMSLVLWQSILDRHRIDRDWSGVPDKVIDEIAAEISAVARGIP